MIDCSYCHGNHERADCPNVPTWRDEVIEECARVADKWMQPGNPYGTVAAAIRALKDK